MASIALASASASFKRLYANRLLAFSASRSASAVFTALGFCFCRSTQIGALCSFIGGHFDFDVSSGRSMFSICGESMTIGKSARASTAGLNRSGQFGS